EAAMTWIGWLSGGPEDGGRAMSRDEILARRFSEQDAGSRIVRVHGWLRPTLSYGRGQRLAPARLDELRGAGIDRVRRPTGGGWLLHLPGDLAVTLAVAGPLRAGQLRGAARFVSRLIATMLQEAGLAAAASLGGGPERRREEICFQRVDRDEVTVDGIKVAGVAVARLGRSGLVQAAMPLEPAPPELEQLAARWDPKRAAAAAVTQAVDRVWLRRAARAAAGRLAGAAVRRASWSPDLLREAERLVGRLDRIPAAAREPS
ncbi:MAG: hypothetical protein JSV80_04780, partial [Acidobacteriota bacterium]